MERCPFCGSEDIYFSKKRKLFVCEDCDKTFSEQQLSEELKSASTDGGLELFFSYGHDRNRLLVERIKRDLEKRGHHVWIDTSEIKAGDNWRDGILNGVLNASSVIAFLSEHSTRNPGVCLDELKIAVCVKGADIKTVLLEPENRIKPPATISDIQWLDMSDWYEIKKSSDTDFEQWYKEKFSELCRVIESSESVELSGDIHILKTKLSPYLNSEKEYSLLSKEFYGRRWLGDYIEEWQDKRNTKALILYGRPGSGKSAFSVNYSHFNSDVYGCFLCEWNREYTTNPNRLIRTMAFRLASKLPDYRSILLHQLDTDLQLDEMNPEALFDFLLAYPLSHLVDGNRETGIIVVDGLDEAEVNGDNPLAAAFSKCMDRMPRWIRFVFTSRPERNVSKYFQSCESLDIIGDIPVGYNDIMAYLVKSLAVELQLVSNKLEILKKICELSDGIFLYAELLVADLKSGIIKMNELNSFPKGLNSFYRISMERKFPDQTSFIQVREMLELLSIADTLPEELLLCVSGYKQYAYLTCLDKLGSYVNRVEENGLIVLGFSHKSFRDWFVNRSQSGEFYIDYESGALRAARFCKDSIDNSFHNGSISPALQEYMITHVGFYYVSAKQFAELEDFLLSYKQRLDPFWRIWRQFPETWNNSRLLNAFWTSDDRDSFLKKLQREGNVNFLSWIFDIAALKYGIKDFSKELVTVYMDIVHMSGQYSRAVSIAGQYLSGQSSDVSDDEFLAMLSVRRIHHAMFYKPVGHLLDEAKALLARIGSKFPKVYNELLFLIGGNLGVLQGDWGFCKEWLEKSERFATSCGLTDFSKRNARKMADCYCHAGEFDKAESLIEKYISMRSEITGRYEAYLVGALANLYTCMSNDDEALECYEQLLKYTSTNGIVGWTAHAYLGIANTNFRLGNTKEAVDFAKRASSIYSRIQQEWGLIMTEALLAACESRVGIAPIHVACDKAIRHAQRMQYGSCVSSIEDLCSGKNNFLELYFL